MPTNFDELIDRRGTASIKYDFAAERGYPKDVLPFWVADMDFRAPAPVLDALTRRTAHGIFGYTQVKDDYFAVLENWFRTRHNWAIERRDLIVTPGVVFAVAAAIRTFTNPNDSVLIQPPVYYPFANMIRQNDRTLIDNPLHLRNGHYEIDFEDFERQARDPRTTLFILCSPHNPAGRVWSREDLERLGDICAKNGVRVFADELHCDILMPGYKHQPFGNVDAVCRENSMTVIAPSKTFNLAGLQATILITPDPRMRLLYENVLARNSIPRPNLFAITGLEAAYRHGERWLDELLVYIKGNYDFLVNDLQERLPQVRVMPLEGTFLAWMDFSALEPDPYVLQKRMLTEANVWLDEGWVFGPEGNGFERLVLACPRSILKEALDRIVRAFGR